MAVAARDMNMVPLRKIVNLALNRRIEQRQLDLKTAAALRFILGWKQAHPDLNPRRQADSPTGWNADGQALLVALAGTPALAHVTTQTLGGFIHDIDNIMQVVSLLEGPNSAKYLARLQQIQPK